MSLGHVCRFFGYSFPYTVLYSPCLFCNYLFVFLNPLNSHPFPHSYLPPILLSSTFAILIMVCLGESLVVSILGGTLCASLACKSISFTKLGKFSFIIFPNRFSFFKKISIVIYSQYYFLLVSGVQCNRTKKYNLVVTK